MNNREDCCNFYQSSGSCFNHILTLMGKKNSKKSEKKKHKKKTYVGHAASIAGMGGVVIGMAYVIIVVACLVSELISI